jgi:hypothetical protein
MPNTPGKEQEVARVVRIKQPPASTSLGRTAFADEITHKDWTAFQRD